VTLAVTFYGSTKTAASEYLQIRAQIRTAKETSLIVNGGHYMTRGHVILCLLYLKKRRMSRNILELKREPFRVCKRTIAKVVPPYFPAPTEGDPLSFLQPTVRVKAPPPHARREWVGVGENIWKCFTRASPVCFFRHTRMVFPGQFCPSLFSTPAENRSLRRGAASGKPQRLIMHAIVYHRYLLKPSCPAPDACKSVASGPPVGAVIAKVYAYLFTAGAFGAAAGEGLGLDIAHGWC
jgi:hypothetical protein